MIGMNKTQKILYRLIKEFDEICRSNGVCYAISGGTALGAVRHGGFIPWDDDVDILVTRDEYVKLDAAMNNIKNKDRAWITEDNTPGFNNPIARYYDLTTTCIFRNMLDDGAPNGHHLEIFIGDPYPSDPIKRVEHMKYLWLYTEVRNPFFTSSNMNMPVEMMDKDLYYYYKNRVEELGADVVKNELLEKLTHPREECDAYCGRWSYIPIEFKYEHVDGYGDIPFRDLTLMGGKGIVDRIERNYGYDWNLVPKKTKRVVHDTIENTHHSYREHQAEVKEICERENYNQLLLDDKNDKLELNFETDDYQRAFFKMKQVQVNIILSHLEAEELSFDPENKRALLQRLQEFFDEVLQKAYFRYHFPVNISDSLFETMLLVLIHNNLIEKATRLLQLCPDSSLFDKYKTVIELIRKLKIEKYRNDIAAVKKTLEELDEEYPYTGQIEIERTRYWYMVQAGQFVAEENTFDRIILENDEDIEIEKYLGDYLFNNGKIKEATKRYRKARLGKNGMLLKDLDDIGVFKGEIVRDVSLEALELLDEFSAICERNNISFVVGGVIPKILQKKIMENFGFVQVYMETDQMLKFLDIIKTDHSEGREVEYYGNNSLFPFFSIRYVNTNTSVFRLEEAHATRKNGVYVEILPIRSKKVSSTNPKDIIEKGKMMNSRNGRERYLFINKEKQLLMDRFNRLFAKRGNKANKKLFTSLCNYYKPQKKENRMWIYNANWNTCVFPREYLNCQEEPLLGYNIRIPKDIKSYNKRLYYDPKAKKKLQYPETYNNYYRIIDLNNSCVDTIAKINKCEDLIEDAFSNAIEVDYYNSLVEKRKETYDIVWNEIDRLYSKE